jgi:ABC-type transport system involved in multi-copper enzyme maturation permease subunit
MPFYFGPGPVFVYESIAATRRPQFYAARAFFVVALLASLVFVWSVMRLEEGRPLNSITFQQLAQIGEYFFYAISTTQLIAVILIAPAVTAGAVCLDRARGNLTHMLTTDLSSSEIVLGKLAARLVRVLALVATTVPVLALAGLLGGIIFESILSLLVVTLGLALLGCTLALAISVRATKTHEVLMMVYGILAVWILSPAIWEMLAGPGFLPRVPQWLVAINPFVIAWMPYIEPNVTSYQLVAFLVAFVAATLLLSSIHVVYAVRRLRADMTLVERPRQPWLGARLARVSERLLWWRPGPSLDNDPVLWREWRRGRPSRLARVVWGAYIILAIAGVGLGWFTIRNQRGAGEEFLKMTNGITAMFGLLLVSLYAPTVLAEERVRGSLDLMMTTPLSTDRIVFAKWRSAFRPVPALAVIPFLGCLIIAVYTPLNSLSLWEIPPRADTVNLIDRIACLYLPTALFLAQGAVVASVGIALATWFKRVGRAIAVSVALNVLFSFGWILIVEFGTALVEGLGLIDNELFEGTQFFAHLLMAACPLGSQFSPFAARSLISYASPPEFYAAQLGVVLVTLELALLLLALVIATFNHCVGRASERPRRVRNAPRTLTLPNAPLFLKLPRVTADQSQ